MAKQQTFAEKASKSQMKRYPDCKTCGAPLMPVLLVATEKQANGAYKFRHHNIRVCKCNEKAVYG